jgi:2'-5' RNA ligase
MPHITLAMDDLTEQNFDKAWNRFKRSKIEFEQELHNICLVKWCSDGEIKIAKRYELK